MARTRTRIGGGRHDVRERRVLAMASRSEHHSVYANPRQYPPKEKPILWPRAFHVRTGKQSLYLSCWPVPQLRWPGLSESSLQLHRDTKKVWPVLAPTTMHQCCLPGSYHPPERTSPTTCAGVGQHARVRQSTAAKKEGGSLIRGTQESDWAAALAPAEIKVRAGAVLPGGGGPEHQATGPLPQPTDHTHYASCLVAEVRTKNSAAVSRKDIPITDFFNTHGIYQQTSPLDRAKPQLIYMVAEALYAHCPGDDRRPPNSIMHRPSTQLKYVA